MNDKFLKETIKHSLIILSYILTSTLFLMIYGLDLTPNDLLIDSICFGGLLYLISISIALGFKDVEEEENEH